jgi:enediyne biosynthesis protein E4
MRPLCLIRMCPRRRILGLLALAAWTSGCGDSSTQALPVASEALPVAGDVSPVGATVESQAANGAAADPKSPIQFRDISSQTQIPFCHTDGNGGKFYIIEAAASGLATFDFDGDGLEDIYFLSGTPLKGAAPDAPPGGNVLYRNLGGFQFQDVTAAAGIGPAGYGVGVAAGDYNNDGHPDLYVSNFGPKVLYRNNGDGSFTDVTSDAGVADGDQFGAGVCFLDIDNDSHLDLYVANYSDFSYETHVTRSRFGIPIYPGPIDFIPLPSSLFRNRGDGTFEDISKASGIREQPGTSMGAVCADYDNDGATDIICANDNAANFCFHNEGGGKFKEVGTLTGLAFNADGLVVGNMGLDCADYDNDGWLDFFITTYQREAPILFRNLGAGSFRDVTAKAAQTQRCYNNSKWGTGFADFDNDGWKDILVGIGHLQVNIEQWDKTSSYAAPPMLLRNNGKGRFEDVSDTSGDGLKVDCVARGVALEDLDNDGRIDVVISNSRRPPVILRNESENNHHWLHIKLRGVKVNRDAVGARVTVTAGDLKQIDEVHSGRGYQSHFGTRLHFGLADHKSVDKIEVRWPGGFTESWEDIQSDQILTLTEGSGTAAK